MVLVEGSSLDDHWEVLGGQVDSVGDPFRKDAPSGEALSCTSKANWENEYLVELAAEFVTGARHYEKVRLTDRRALKFDQKENHEGSSIPHGDTRRG